MGTAQHWHRLTITGYLGVIFVLMAWYAWLAPPTVLPIYLVLLLLVTPLMLPLRGVLHGRAYTVAWSLFLSLFYLTHGVVEAYSEPAARWLAFVEIGASLLWFGAGILYVRASKREQSAAAG